MDYKVASNIRGKSFSDLMSDKISGGAGIGSSLRGAISDKMKAKATGIKEKFDPMNIARAMTGGSRLAPAILGKLTGRSRADIDYFAGNKNKKSSYTQVPNSMSTPGENLGGSAVSVLNKMLSFMVSAREEDMKKRDTAKQFNEEQRVEDQRRHNAFLSVLKEYTSLSGTGSTTQVKKEDGGLLSGFMDIVKSMISTAVSGVLVVVNGLIDGFKKSLEWLGDLKILMSTLGGNAAAKLLSLGKFLLNPFTIGLFAAIAGGAAIMWLGEKLKDYFRENVVNMNALSPEKAAELLQTPDAFREIEKYGGRDAVMKIAKEGYIEAAKILATGDIKKINDAGGEEFLKKVVARGAVEVPESAANEDLSQFAEQGPKRPKGTGSATSLKQEGWDKKWSKVYDPETGKRLDLIGSPAPLPTKTPEAPATAPVPKQESTSTPATYNAAKDSQSASVQTAPTTFNAAKDGQTATVQTAPATYNAAKDSQLASVMTSPATFNAANPIPEENKITPVPSAPMSSRMNDAVIENQSLSLNTTGNTQTPVAPIISTINNSTNTQDRPIPATATVRDTTPILDHVVQMSVVPI
jgi:hypothetical protein